MENKIYGYARISTNKQSIERQITNIRNKYEGAIIVKEIFTGTKIEGRKQFEKLLKRVKPGDRIVFDSVSRMSRNAEEGFALYEELYSKGIELEFLKEPQVNTETYKQSIAEELGVKVEDITNGDEFTNGFMKDTLEYVDKIMKRLIKRQIKIAFDQAEKEVTDLHERTKEGIREARAAGKQIGQKKGAKLTTKKYLSVKNTIIKKSKRFNGTMNDTEVSKVVGIGRATFYRYVEKINAELEAAAKAENETDVKEDVKTDIEAIYYPIEKAEELADQIEEAKETLIENAISDNQ